MNNLELTQNETKVYIAYGLNKSYRAIAAFLGITRKEVDNTLIRIRRKV